MIEFSEEYKERVKTRIEKNVFKDEDFCWIWKKGKQRLGYGIIGILQNKKSSSQLVHRISYHVWKEDPKDKFVLHTCCKRDCCNPDHLYLGDQTDNMRDRTRDGHHSVGDRKGMKHPMSKFDSNTILSIRQDFLNGMKGKEIAEKYNINKTYSYDIKNRKRWKHI